MKKYILFILILLIAFVSNAQTFQNYNQYGGRWKRSITDTLQGLPADTIRPRASEDDVPFIAVKNDTVYVWSIDQLRWLPLSVAGGGTLGSARTELISGGIVIPLGGYDFFVTAALYRIDNILYTSDTVTLTLPVADNDSSRIDRFYLNIDGEATFKTGDLAPPASVLEPQLDGDQLGLAFVAVNAGASEPAIITLIIYDENTGESVVTNQGTTTDPDNTTNVQNGTKSLNVTNINDPTGGGFDAVFIDRTSPLTWQVLGFDGVTGWIKLKQILVANADFRIQLFRGTQAVSSEVIISLNKNDITNYQPFTIPGPAFGNVTNTEITRVRIRYTRPGNTSTHSGFYLDNFYFIDGVVQPPPAIVSMTLNVPASMTVSPSNTIQSGGTWNLTFNGQADEYISGNGVATAFPDIPNKVGLIQGRTPNTNRGMTIDADSIFLDSASLTNYGVMSPYAYDKLFNYVVQQYYIQNLGNGDTLARPINDTVTGIKSIVFDDHYGITDSTIHIDTTAASGATPGLQDVITEDNQLTGSNQIDINTGSLEFESTAYPSGLIKAGNNGIVTIGDAGADGNSSYIEIDDGLETMFIRADAGVTIASPLRVNQLGGGGTRVVTTDNDGDLSATTITGYSTEVAQDDIAPLFTADNGDIDFTYNDGTPDIAAVIKNDAVSYAKIQNVSAASKLLGRGDSGSGDVQEITLGTGLTMTGTTLSATGGESNRFGVSGEDDVAGEDRGFGFDADVYYFAIQGTSAVNTSTFGFGNENSVDFKMKSTGVLGESYFLVSQGGAAINVTGGILFFEGLNTTSNSDVKVVVVDSTDNLVYLKRVSELGGGGSYTDEQAQDAIGTMVNATLTYNDGTPLLSIADRDWGPFTSSSNGTVFDIDNLAIVNADINDVAWGKITGTPTTLSGYGITDALSNSTTSTQDGYFSTIKLKDVTNPSHYITIRNNEDLTAARTLSIITGDADRTLTLTGNATISGTNTGDQTSVTGNAGTATALQTPRNIQGVAFDGTANIDPINGTGFVKVTGTTISYDNSTYLTTSSAASTYQPLDADLTTISGLTATTDNFLVSVSSAWASRTPAQVKTTLALNNVENTALSTWAGSSNITTLGTIATGSWNATAIGTAKGGTPSGGTTNQVLTKNSNSDYDYSWQAASGGGLTASNFVFGEVPSGTVNGSNTAFTLANTPTSGTVRVFQNGIRLKVTEDYTISGTTITFNTAPATGDLLLTDYMK